MVIFPFLPGTIFLKVLGTISSPNIYFPDSTFPFKSSLISAFVLATGHVISPPLPRRSRRRYAGGLMWYDMNLDRSIFYDRRNSLTTVPSQPRGTFPVIPYRLAKSLKLIQKILENEFIIVLAVLQLNFKNIFLHYLECMIFDLSPYYLHLTLHTYRFVNIHMNCQQQSQFTWYLEVMYAWICQNNAYIKAVLD